MPVGYGDWCLILSYWITYLQHSVLQPLLQLPPFLAHIAPNHPQGLLCMWVSHSLVIVIVSLYGLHLQFITDLNPPTKLLNKFCVSWIAQKEKNLKSDGKLKEDDAKEGDDEELKGDENTESVHNPATVALALSTCLIARRHKNALMNMTSGVEMLALGITICTEVCILHLLLPILIFSSV